MDTKESINELTRICHKANVDAGWWHDINTGQPLDRNEGELLMLIVSEIAEAMEGLRKNLMDSHLPNRKAAEVELADALIRIFDFAGAAGMDLGGALVEKMEYVCFILRSQHHNNDHCTLHKDFIISSPKFGNELNIKQFELWVL